MSKFADQLWQDAGKVANVHHRNNLRSASIVLDEMEEALRAMLDIKVGNERERAENALRRLGELSK